MKNITRWKPDTCECVIEYEWDSQTSEDDRVHTANRVVYACPAHANLLDKHNIHSTVQEENQRKNVTIGRIVREHPHLAKQGNPDEHDPNAVAWRFDASRRLKITVDGSKLNNVQKKALGKRILDKTAIHEKMHHVKMDHVDIE